MNDSTRIDPTLGEVVSLWSAASSQLQPLNVRDQVYVDHSQLYDQDTGSLV